MNDDQDFIDAILADPGDDTLRLVYADWLEERGDRRAEYLRIEAALAGDGQTRGHRQLRRQLNELRQVIDRHWQALLDRVPLENCHFRSALPCPNRWERLKPTPEPNTRSCDSCRQKVYYCGTLQEARQHALRGHCVAVNSHEARRPGDLGNGLRSLVQVNRIVRDYQFIPVDGSSLGELRRCHFERLTPPLLELGFQPIGDFLMKPEPVVVHDRILLSADGQTLATVCCVLDAGVVSFMSVLDDGTGVHTSGSPNPHPERTFEPADQLLLTYWPDSDPTDIHRQHQETLRTSGARRGGRVMQFHRDQFRAIMVYDQCLFNRWRHRHGGLDHEPPAPDFATLVAVAK
jgi:uncharacterized protein (TIGR02996 family)